MTRTLSFLSLIFATGLFAQPKITSVTPSSGPTSGDSTVTIRGIGFDTTCPPAPLPCGQTSVLFGQVPVNSFRVIDQNTLEAVTPPYLPGAVDVEVRFPNGAAALRSAFTFTGEPTDAFERIVVPLLVPPTTPGAFGSQFVTDFSLWGTGGENIPVFGVGHNPCAGPIIILCPGVPSVFLTNLRPRVDVPVSAFNTYGNPGLTLWIPKGAYDRIAASLRVRDLSRQLESWGTAVPLVPEREFRTGFLALLDVPLISGFRDTLRMYSIDPDVSAHVRVVRFDGSVSREFDVDLGILLDMFHPGYAQIGDFPLDPYLVRIEIEPRPASKRIWAFMSVTHNETQHITIVTPH